MTLFLRVAVVPEMVSGSQTYVLRIRLSLTQRSPMYTKLSPTGRTNVVCEAYVLEPESANFFQPDHGPDSDVAVL